jgi:DNA polymerase-4
LPSPSAPAKPGENTIQRKIIHVDMDCFFAAIEMRDFPELRGRPVAVGGAPEKRGVIATANYEARTFGVRSALPTRRALQLCPHLVLRRPRFDVYKEESQRIQEIFADYTSVIEPLSLDEAFLDVSHSRACRGLASQIAKEICLRILKDTQLTASAGVASNKFIAKVASDWHKPNGIKVVLPHENLDFVSKLPIEKIFGVGPVTATKMHNVGISFCHDLQRFSIPKLNALFGKRGIELYNLCRGIDDRPVQTQRARKSLSVEQTYAQDLPHLMACIKVLPELYRDFELRFHKMKSKKQIKGWIVKVKWSDFEQTSMERSNDNMPSLEDFIDLFSKVIINQPDRAIRLLGLGIKFKDPSQFQKESSQLKLEISDV